MTLFTRWPTGFEFVRREANKRCNDTRVFELQQIKTCLPSPDSLFVLLIPFYFILFHYLRSSSSSSVFFSFFLAHASSTVKFSHGFSTFLLLLTFLIREVLAVLWAKHSRSCCECSRSILKTRVAIRRLAQDPMFQRPIIVIVSYNNNLIN